MTTPIEITDLVGFNVEGTFNDADAKPVKYDFLLQCEVLPAEELDELQKTGGDMSTIDFMLRVIKNWKRVVDADGAQVPYSPDEYRKLCKRPGLARQAFRRYMNEVAIKEKN